MRYLMYEAIYCLGRILCKIGIFACEISRGRSVKIFKLGQQIQINAIAKELKLCKKNSKKISNK